MSRKLLPLNPRQMVGLADGNSFYCSCEESMQPWLHGKPIIVASNNDGCAIAMNGRRSDTSGWVTRCFR